MRMELIENLLQLLVTFVGALLSGISYRKSRRQAYFLLLCFYGCFALGSLYWTLYLLLFDTTPRVFYVSEFGWVASLIFLRILQATLASQDERSFRSRSAWLAPASGVPLLVFYCTFGDILSNLIWCGMMIWLSFCAIRGLVYADGQTGAARNMRYFHIGVLCFAFAEYLLWTVGCFWPDTSPASPTFWCDMLAAGLRSRRFMSRRKIRNAFLISKMLLLCKYFSSNRYDVDYLIKKYYIKEESDLQPLKG